MAKIVFHQNSCKSIQFTHETNKYDLYRLITTMNIQDEAEKTKETTRKMEAPPPPLPNTTATNNNHTAENRPKLTDYNSHKIKQSSESFKPQQPTSY